MLPNMAAEALLRFRASDRSARLTLLGSPGAEDRVAVCKR
jgi:hypothetical protein